MILLTAAKMPDGLDKSILAQAVGLMFSNFQNEGYFREIKERENDFSACESLFALALLYDQICNLPCPIDPSQLVFERGECGKPYFRDSDVKFNISHSKGYVACTVSVGEELGVDIEAAEISADRAERLAKRYFSAEERSDIEKAPESFARRWTEKEAKAKFFAQSIGNILLDGKNTTIPSDFIDFCYHRFAFGKIPITLCTKRDYSTIIFTAQ